MHVSAVQGKEACTRTHWHIPSTTHTRTPSTRHTAWDKAQPRAADPGVPYRQCREHATRDVRRDGDDELPVRTKTRAWRSRWVTGGACARRRPPANRRGVRPPKGANIVRSSLPLPLPCLSVRPASLPPLPLYPPCLSASPASLSALPLYLPCLSIPPASLLSSSAHVDLGTLPRVDLGQLGAVGGRDRRADRTVALSYTDAVAQTACLEERSQVCDEIRLTLAEVRRRTPSAVPAWGPWGTTPRLTVRGTTAGTPPPPPPPS